MLNAFFVVGCARSATTACARILQTATNAVMHVEQEPKLRIESRDVLRGLVADPAAVVFQAKDGPIRAINAQGRIYGDKSPTYMPFIPHLTRLWNAKIVFLVRDGRDVVRSHMDWIRHIGNNALAMAEDEDGAACSRPEESPWDYSRIRPNPGEPMYEGWKQLSRFEKFAWHWANFNHRALELLEQVESDRWMPFNMTGAVGSDYRRMFDFLELEGFDAERVGQLATARINSVKDRIGREGDFPKWPEWDRELHEMFERHAGFMMVKLGYGKESARSAA